MPVWHTSPFHRPCMFGVVTTFLSFPCHFLWRRWFFCSIKVTDLSQLYFLRWTGGLIPSSSLLITLVTFLLLWQNIRQEELKKVKVHLGSQFPRFHPCIRDDKAEQFSFYCGGPGSKERVILTLTLAFSFFPLWACLSLQSVFRIDPLPQSIISDSLSWLQISLKLCLYLLSLDTLVTEGKQHTNTDLTVICQQQTIPTSTL